MKLDLDAIEARAKARMQPPISPKPGSVDEAMQIAAKNADKQLGFLKSVVERRDRHKPDLTIDMPTVLALVARAREADRLEERWREMSAQEDGVTRCAEAQTERAETAEAKVSRLRAVVEKLRDGLKPFGAVSVSRIFPDSTWTHCETYPLERDDGLPGGRTQALWIDGMPVSVFRTAARLLAETALETAQSREASDA